MKTLSQQHNIEDRIIDAIRSVVGNGPVALHEPYFCGKERDYVAECIDSTYVSSVGRFVDRFESDLAAYTGAKHAVAMVNGTSALHVALQLAGVKQNHEVLVPALTFAATAAAVVHCGAIPHFVDSNAKTLGLDAQTTGEYLGDIAQVVAGQCINRQTGRVIRAIVPMHTFGHPVEMEAVLALARRFHLQVVEDAAESLGSSIGARHTGTFGVLGTLSFNGNKVITTGGGGAILTDDSELAARAKHLTTTAKQPHRWEFRHDEVGYNYRLPNLNAALGCAQLEQLPMLLQAKRNLFGFYREAFSGIPGVTLVDEPTGCKSNFWLQTLLLDESIADARDTILTATNDAGLMTRPAWNLLPGLRPYQDCPSMVLTVAHSLERRIINIPSSAQLAMRTANK